MVQRVAECCRVLQCVAVCCRNISAHRTHCVTAQRQPLLTQVKQENEDLGKFNRSIKLNLFAQTLNLRVDNLCR